MQQNKFKLLSNKDSNGCCDRNNDMQTMSKMILKDNHDSFDTHWSSQFHGLSIASSWIYKELLTKYTTFSLVMTSWVIRRGWNLFHYRVLNSKRLYQLFSKTILGGYQLSPIFILMYILYKSVRSFSSAFSYIWIYNFSN